MNYLLHTFFIILFCITGTAFTSLSDDDTSESGNVTLVFVGLRHGFRNPSMFLKNDSSRAKYGWGWEGENQLTNIGKLQGYSLGEFLRNRYADQTSTEYFPNKIRAVSSSAERAQLTLQCVLAGLYKPLTARSKFRSGLDWQPIAYQISDTLLRTYNLKCPAYTKAYKPISDDSLAESVSWLKNKSVLAQYIAKNSGFNASLSDLADAADNLQSMVKNNVPLPAWVEKPNLPGYTKETLLKEALKFGEAHQIQCAQKRDCAKSMAGLWLNEILSSIRKAANKTEAPPFFISLYTAHTETVLSLLNLIRANVTETSPSAGFILEYKKIAGKPAIRLFEHEPGKDDPEKRNIHQLHLPFKKIQSSWYHFSDFETNVNSNSFDDWFEFCGSPGYCFKNSCSP